LAAGRQNDNERIAMKKRYVFILLTIIAGLATFVSTYAASPEIRIGGEVACPLTLSMDDLSHFQSVRVQLN
jgi:DMSO/TMAO reductase YedYZ molybdopterin-dependent catalytic subunit